MAATPPVSPKRVLILYSYGRNFSPFGPVASEFQTELAQRFHGPIEFHEASLESPRFVGGDSDEPVVNYLRAAFEDREPDLIVPCGGPAVRFTLRQRARLFPSTPLLLAAVDARHLQPFTLDTNTTAVAASFDLPGVVENVRRLLPGTTNIQVVLGGSPLEGFWKGEMEREFKPFMGQISFTWLNELSLPAMEERLSHLPPRTVIFYFTIFIDAAGVPYEYDRALKAIRATANAPIVGLFEESLGEGLLGGPLISIRQQSAKTAQVGVRILNGEPAGDIRVPPLKPQIQAYDWQELRRWSIPESRLPAGSEARFRETGYFAQYRGRILGTLGVCAVEAVLILALLRELRRRRESERSLRESEERMTLAAGAADLAMWEWDMVADRILATGALAGRFLRATAAQPDYNHFMQSVHAEDRDAVAQAMAKARNGGGDYESVHRTVYPGERVRWIAARGRVEFDAKGKPVRMRGVSMDITNRKQADERARESERRFRLMADSAPVLIWAAEPDKRCSFFNRPWLEFTGRRLEQELGDGWAEGVHSDDMATCLQTYSEAFDARRPFAMEYRLRRHDGQYRWMLDTGVPRYDADKTFLGYIGSCVDVTERKEAEVETRRAREELAHMGRVSTLGELAGSLAHELNQPLTAILSNAQAAHRLLNDGSVDAQEVREILGDIIAEDRRAGEVIVQMRAMLKKGEAQMLPQDLNLVIGEVVGIMHSELVSRQVAVDTELVPDLPLVKGDRVQLQQVLLNLVVNGCDAMSGQPALERRLTIRTERAEPGLVQVTVTDRGPGFSPEILARAFEPFATTKPNGLGLGLAICRSIITAHVGRVWVANNAEGGASVRFALGVYGKEVA